MGFPSLLTFQRFYHAGTAWSSKIFAICYQRAAEKRRYILISMDENGIILNSADWPAKGRVHGISTTTVRRYTRNQKINT